MPKQKQKELFSGVGASIGEPRTQWEITARLHTADAFISLEWRRRSDNQPEVSVRIAVADSRTLIWQSTDPQGAKEQRTPTDLETIRNVIRPWFVQRPVAGRDCAAVWVNRHPHDQSMAFEREPVPVERIRAILARIEPPALLKRLSASSATQS